MENLRGRLPAQRAGLSRTQQHSSSYQGAMPSRNRVLARSTATATRTPSPTAAAQEPGAVISQLVGKKVLQLNPELSTVPLLDPITHCLPFAAALQIYSSVAGARSSSSSRGAACTSDSRQEQLSSSSGSLVELHYVISGKGHFSSVTSGGQQVALGPGDSIISLQGAANFAAGPVRDLDLLQQQQQQPSNTQEQQQQGTSPAWSQLLGWLQQLHTAKPQQSSNVSPSDAAATVGTVQQAGSSSSNQLVMLQLLLPSELLTGEMLTHHAGHCHAVAQQLPWHPAALQQQPAAAALGGAGSSIHLHGLASTDSIHETHVCSLLGDGGLASPQQSASQEQQQSSHKEDGPVSHHHHQQEEQQHATTGSPNSTADSPGSPGNSGNSGNSGSSDSSGSAHAVLPRLDQQQILKRALSEVGAFRLPQQTNRLALLFGPHCSPAVCCSFGVEVFEPGHVTPLHIHNTAHELFFVLAGKGEAVFSNSSSSSQGSSQPTGPQQQQQQRVQVSPGDVAVFPPGVVHGVDNPGGSQLYCLQMMLPNEFFVEFVRSGEEAGRLDVTDVQALAAAASCG